MLEDFLNPEIVRPKLIVASVYIAAYEVLKSTIVQRIKSFYTLGGIYKEDHPKYQSEVLSRNRSPVYASLDWLRESHAIDDNETLPDPRSSRYNVYVLDVSQLAAQRAWQVDFTGWIKRERRRARKLVFTLSAGEEATEGPQTPGEGAYEQLALDDELAVVDAIDAPAGSPLPDGSIAVTS